MSSSERSSSGESDDESLPDLQKLKPYDLEPEILSLDGISTSSDEEELSSSDCEAESRIGKTYSYCTTYQHHCFNNKTKVFTQEHGQAQKFQEFTSFGFNKISFYFQSYFYITFWYFVFL